MQHAKHAKAKACKDPNLSYFCNHQHSVAVNYEKAKLSTTTLSMYVAKFPITIKVKQCVIPFTYYKVDFRKSLRLNQN